MMVPFNNATQDGLPFFHHDKTAQTIPAEHAPICVDETAETATLPADRAEPALKPNLKKY